MADPAADAEPGFFGNEQNAAALRAVRPAHFCVRQSPRNSTFVRGLDRHRRCSSTPFTALSTDQQRAGNLWHCRDAIVKLLWLWIRAMQR
jgi:hypothetical protein